MNSPEEKCQKFLERWKDCRSLGSLIHNYYVYGEKLDCASMKDGYENCLKWSQENTDHSQKCLQQLEDQLHTPSPNVCFWEMRTVPPLDWPKPGAHIDSRKRSVRVRATSLN